MQTGCNNDPVEDGTSCEDGAGQCQGGECRVPKLSAREATSCAVAVDGHIDCWGVRPALPTGLFSDIAMGDGVSGCAIRLDGTAACWSYVGSPPTNTQFSEIVVSKFTACGLEVDTGLASCWGYNWDSIVSNTPATSVFTSIAITEYFGSMTACGVLLDGSIECWGTMGAGMVSSVAGSYQSVAGGHDHFCALSTDGQSVDCWGRNYAGHVDITPPAARFVGLTTPPLK